MRKSGDLPKHGASPSLQVRVSAVYLRKNGCKDYILAAFVFSGAPAFSKYR